MLLARQPTVRQPESQAGQRGAPADGQLLTHGTGRRARKILSAANSPAAATTTSAAGASTGATTAAGGATATTQPSGDAGGVSIPAGAIAGLGGDCLKYIQALSGAFSGAGNSAGTQGVAELSAAFARLATVVPDNIKPDVKVLQDAYGTLGALYAKYNNDFTKIAADPQAQAIFSNPKFAAASAALSTWLSTSCKTAG